MKLIVRKQLNGSLKAVYESDVELLKKIKVDEDVEITLTRPRNIKFHRKFFALINLVFQNQEIYNNPEHLRYDLTIESGFYDVTYNWLGEEIKRAKSISFAKMEEPEFAELYNRFSDAIVRCFKFEKEDIEENINDFF